MATSTQSHWIRVSGFSSISSKTESILKRFFGNPAYCGANNGTIDSIVLENHSILLLYKHKQDAVLVVDQSPFTWANGVQIVCEWATKYNISPMSNEQDVHKPQAKVSSNTSVHVEVSGIPPDTHTQIIELLLKQGDLGGDDIESISMLGLEAGFVVVAYNAEQGARKMLNQPHLKLIDSDLAADRIHPDDVKACFVLVEGFNYTTHQQSIQLYIHFQGGDTIQHIDFQFKHKGHIVVKFKNQSDAETFANKSLELEEATLHTTVLNREEYKLMMHRNTTSITRPEHPNVTYSSEDESIEHDDDVMDEPEDIDEELVTEQQKPMYSVFERTVIVEGIPYGVHGQEIELVFSNDTQGRKDVNTRWMEYGMVEIVYSDMEDFKKVIDTKSFQLGRSTVTVTPAVEFGDYTHYNLLRSRAIKIVYESLTISEEMIKLYFTNKKRGGGAIEDLFHDEKNKVMYITFHSAEVASSIARRQTHTLDNCTLSVSQMMPAPPNRTVPSPFEDEYLLVRYLPLEVTTTDVKKYFGTDGIEDCFFSCTTGIVLCRFRDIPDYDTLLQKCNEVPFKGHMISIQKVPQVKSLQVDGIDDFSQQEIELFFDSECDEQLNCARVYTWPQRYAVLEFDDVQVLKGALDKQPYKYRDHTLTVNPHFHGFGYNSTKCSGSSLWIPENISMTKLDSHILDFILRRLQLKQNIETNMKSINVKVCWPSDKSGPVSLKYCPSNPQSIAQWRHKAIESFKAKIQLFVVQPFEISVETLKYIQTHYQDMIATNDEYVCVTVDNVNSKVYVTGVQNKTLAFVKKLREVIKGAEKILEFRSRLVTEPMTKLKVHQFRLLKNAQNLKQILQIDKAEAIFYDDKTEIELKALPDAITNVKTKIYEEFIHKIDKMLVPLSEEKHKMYSEQIIENQMESAFRDHEMNVVLENVGSQVWIHGMKTQVITAAVKLVQEMVQEIADKQKQAATRNAQPADHTTHSEQSGSRTDENDKMGDTSSDNGANARNVDGFGDKFDASIVGTPPSPTIEPKEPPADKPANTSSFSFDEARYQGPEKKQDGTKLSELEFVTHAPTKREDRQSDKSDPDTSVLAKPDITNPDFSPTPSLRKTRNHDSSMTPRTQIKESDYMFKKPSATDVYGGYTPSFDDVRQGDSTNKPSKTAPSDKRSSFASAKSSTLDQDARYRKVMPGFSRRASAEIPDRYSAVGISPRSGSLRDPGFTVTTERPDKLVISLSTKLTLEVEQGSLDTESTDALIVAASGGNLLVGAVGKSIKLAGGPSLERECTTKGRQSLTVTSGGNLPCFKIIHVDVSAIKSKHMYLQPSDSKSVTWPDILVPAFVEAEQLGCTSVALPAIGTGQLGWSPKQMATAFMETFKQFVAKRTSNVLTKIRIVVFDTDTLSEMTKTMANIVRNPDAVLRRRSYMGMSPDRSGPQSLSDLMGPSKPVRVRPSSGYTIDPSSSNRKY